MNEQALKERLHFIAKEKGIHFNECWKKLLLERFLARLSRSEQTNKFIFKGGFLLSYILEIGRETTDLDFLLTCVNASEEQIKREIDAIILSSFGDGFVFSYDGIKLLEQPHMAYPGYRVSLKAEFGRMRDKVQIDVGIGDVVTPVKKGISLFQYHGKSLFESEVSLFVYPVEAIFAEKLETIISKGAANSRMKDYHDLFLLIRNKDLLEHKKLCTAITNTFQKRGVLFDSVQFDEIGLQALQKLWVAHLKNLGDLASQLSLPKKIHEIITTINNVVTTVKGALT